MSESKDNENDDLQSLLEMLNNVEIFESEHDKVKKIYQILLKEKKEQKSMLVALAVRQKEIKTEMDCTDVLLEGLRLKCPDIDDNDLEMEENNNDM